MALLPSGIIVATKGANAAKNSPTEVRGGVIVGITSATDVEVGNPVTEVFQFSANAIGERDVDTTPKESASVLSTSNQTGVLSGGTFAYNQVEFMMMMSADTINNSSATALLIGGQTTPPPHRSISNKSKGAKTSTAYRAGYWRALGIAGQRTNWSTAPSTNNVAYQETTGTGNADDEAIFVTYKAIPGELAYMDGSPNPIQDEYKGRYGAGLER
jgi:hypothetical protein